MTGVKKIFPLIFLLAAVASAQVLPSVNFGFTQAGSPEDVVASLQIIFLLSILALAPSILVMMTSFVRIIIVFSFIRRAVGLQSTPPDQVLVGLALFLTFFIMSPTFTQINDNALQPYLAKDISWEQGIENAGVPLKQFMLRQVYEKDVALLMRISGKTPPATAMEIGFDVLIPAFMISELKTAFIFGFIIYLPFLVVDMVVASVLLSMGMMMLPPTTVSLPFKVILFVLIDGWNLIVKQLVGSFF